MVREVQANENTDVRISQPITRRDDARELLPEEKLSPLDLEIYDRVIAKAKLLPQETGQDCLNYKMVMDAINEDAGLGSKQFLDTVRWLNGIFPENPIIILSDKYPGLLERIKTQEEISAMEIPESEGLIDKGYKIGIIGKMQSGKSLLALRMGQDLVEGRPILDYFPWDRKWRVLYVNFELPEAEMVARFSLFGNNPDYVLLNLTIIDMTKPDESKPIVDTLEAYKEAGKPFDALILDPKAMCFGGDENQTKDNIRWCAACDDLIKEYNLCLIIPHHYGRNTSAEGGRGSTSFGGWLTKRLELKGGDGDIRKTLTVHGKVGESLDLLLKLNYPVWEVERATIAIKESKVSLARTFISTHVPEDRTALIRDANLERITQSIFKEAQKQMEQEGLISVVQAEGQGNRKRIIPTL